MSDPIDDDDEAEQVLQLLRISFLPEIIYAELQKGWVSLHPNSERRNCSLAICKFLQSCCETPQLTELLFRRLHNCKSSIFGEFNTQRYRATISGSLQIGPYACDKESSDDSLTGTLDETLDTMFDYQPRSSSHVDLGTTPHGDGPLGRGAIEFGGEYGFDDEYDDVDEWLERILAGPDRSPPGTSPMEVNVRNHLLEVAMSNKIFYKEIQLKVTPAQLDQIEVLFFPARNTPYHGGAFP